MNPLDSGNSTMKSMVMTAQGLDGIWRGCKGLRGLLCDVLEKAYTL